MWVSVCARGPLSEVEVDIAHNRLQDDMVAKLGACIAATRVTARCPSDSAVRKFIRMYHRHPCRTSLCRMHVATRDAAERHGRARRSRTLRALSFLQGCSAQACLPRRCAAFGTHAPGVYASSWYRGESLPALCTGEQGHCTVASSPAEHTAQQETQYMSRSL